MEQISPLMEACTCKNNTPVIGELLKHKANVNQKDNSGMTPLMYTVIGLARPEEKIEIATMLIKNGAKVSLKDKDGKSAIDYALMGGNRRLAKLLLQAEKMQDREKRAHISAARKRAAKTNAGR